MHGRELLRHGAVIVLVASAVLFTNLGASRLWDRDEPRNAGCAAEMLARNDWVVPVFGGELRDHKPILLYWLIMSAYSVLGVNEFSARFWSATLAVGTTLCTYAIGRRLFNSRVGLWSAVILSTALMFDVAGRAATPDSVLIFLGTAAITVFVLTTFRRGEGVPIAVTDACFPTSWPAAAAIYGLMGLAMLAKGPVGLVLPTAVIGMTLLILRLPDRAARERTVRGDDDGRPAAGRRLLESLSSAARPFTPTHFLRTCWAMRPLTALAVSLAVAAPWYVLVSIATEGEFPRGFFLVHNMERAVSAMEGHDGSVLYYPIAVLVGFFPWSVFIGGTLIGACVRARRDDPWRVGYVLSLCWVGVYLGLFSLASTKLPSYVTPCYPGLALLSAAFLHHWSRHQAVAPDIWPRLSFLSMTAVGVAMSIALPLVSSRYFPGEQWLGIIGAIPIVGGVTGLLLTRRGRNGHAALSFTATAVLLACVLFGLVTVRLDRHQQNHRILATIERFGPDVEVGAFECLEPTWIFYGRRPLRELAASPPPAPRIDSGAHDWRRRPKVKPEEFLQSGESRLIITTRAQFQQHRTLFPGDMRVVVEAPYFLKKDRLVLLAPAAAARRVAVQSDGHRPKSR